MELVRDARLGSKDGGRISRQSDSNYGWHHGQGVAEGNKEIRNRVLSRT